MHAGNDPTGGRVGVGEKHKKNKLALREARGVGVFVLCVKFGGGSLTHGEVRDGFVLTPAL